MQTKRRSVASVLAVVIMLVVTVLGFALSKTNTANGSEAFETVKLDSTDVSAYATSGYEDFSNYTDQELPGSIDKNNISKYVPIDKFNKDGTTIYNGRNYGFVIYSSAKTNHVLLFKETYNKTGENKYEVEFKVLYTNSFFKSGNSIMNAYSPYSIALSNVDISEFILDVDMQKNIVTPSYSDYNKDLESTYFTHAGLSGDISYLDKDKTYDDVLITVIEMERNENFDETLSYDIADLTVNAEKNKNYLLKTVLGNSPVNLYNTPRRSINLAMDAGADDFLAYKSGNQNYLKASFELGATANNSYYIYNNISFDVCLYNAVSVSHKGRISSQSVFSLSEDTDSNYGILDRKGDGYTLTEYQRFTPMLYNDNVFKFTPDKAKKYKFTTPEGYYATVGNNASNADNVFAVGAQGGVMGFTTEVGGKTSGNLHGERLIAQDFIGGNFTFANIGIERAQELKLGATNLDSEIPTYRAVKTSEIANDLYVLDTTGYVGSIDLHILDEDMNIVQTSTRYGKDLVINYPMSAGKKYYIVCDNKDYTAQALTFANKGELLLGASEYQNIQNLYYKYDAPKYTQYYKTFAKQIFDSQGDVVAINDGDAFLEAGKTYYMQSGISRLMTSISNSHVNKITSLGETFECSLNYNEVFEFIPKVSAQYTFVDGTYDIYRNWTLIAEDERSFYMNEGEIPYQFVKRQRGGAFTMDMVAEELKFGLNVLNLTAVNGRNQFYFDAEQKLRMQYTIMPSNNVYIYDSALNLSVYDHGYAVPKGRNYIVIEGSGECAITLEEYLQPLNVELRVDGEKYDYDGVIYYGKDFVLPVVTKERYNFLGWKNGDEFVTDANGQSIAELKDDAILTACFALRGAVVQVNSNGKSFWWDGSKMVSDGAVTVYQDGDIESIRQAVIETFENTPECIKEGYYASSLAFTLISSDAETDYYTLSMSWVRESYKVTFIINGKAYAMTESVQYGATITAKNFPAEVFATSNSEYYITGWQIVGSDKTIKIITNTTVGDYTPSVGSDCASGYVEVTMIANIEYVKYGLTINNKYYEIPDDGYVIQSLEYYGYDPTKYYGTNLWFGYGSYTKYYIGDVVNKKSYKSNWKTGDTSVTIDLTLKYDFVEVTLVYRVYCENNEIEVESKNDRMYTGTPFELSGVTVRGWKFDHWECEGRTISEINYANLGITSYYSNKYYNISITKILITNLTAYEISDTNNRTVNIDTSIGVARIYGYSYQKYYNTTFVIYPSVKEVTFANGKWYNTKIEIMDREEDSLVMNFDNVVMKARDNESVIDCKSFIEIFYSMSKAEFIAGDVTNDANNSKPKAAIIATDNLAFGGEEFVIRGGNSSSVDYNASPGIDCDNVIMVFARKIEVFGGNGGLGHTGDPGDPAEAYTGSNGAKGGTGGKGGEGAPAIIASGVGIFVRGSKVICHGGTGGQGGIGGKGGKGADGKDGKLGVSTIDPGNGGTGGQGGKGGKGGVGAIFELEPAALPGEDEAFEFYVGDGGAGGHGGIGGQPGDPCETIWGNPRTGSYGYLGDEGEKGDSGDAGYIFK